MNALKTFKRLVAMTAIVLIIYFRQPLTEATRYTFQANMVWLAIIGSVVVAIVLAKLVIAVVNRVRFNLKRRQLIKIVQAMYKKKQEAENDFIALIKSGKIDQATQKYTYNPATNRFDIRVANDVMFKIIEVWRAEEDVKVTDKISSFAKGWVDYLAIHVGNWDLLCGLPTIIGLFIQEQILPEQEYGHLMFNLQNKFEDAILN